MRTRTRRLESKHLAAGVAVVLVSVVFIVGMNATVMVKDQVERELPSEMDGSDGMGKDSVHVSVLTNRDLMSTLPTEVIIMVLILFAEIMTIIIIVGTRKKTKIDASVQDSPIWDEDEDVQTDQRSTSSNLDEKNNDTLLTCTIDHLARASPPLHEDLPRDVPCIQPLELVNEGTRITLTPLTTRLKEMKGKHGPPGEAIPAKRDVLPAQPEVELLERTLYCNHCQQDVHFLEPAGMHHHSCPACKEPIAVLVAPPAPEHLGLVKLDAMRLNVARILATLFQGRYFTRTRRVFKWNIESAAYDLHVNVENVPAIIQLMESAGIVSSSTLQTVILCPGVVRARNIEELTSIVLEMFGRTDGGEEHDAGRLHDTTRGANGYHALLLQILIGA